MKPLNFVLGWLRKMKLQTKLALGFVFLALLIGVSGGAGLFFVNKISGSVAVFANVSSPLVDETATLVENMQNMRIVMLDALAETDADNVEQHANTLNEIDALTQEGLGRLGRLSADGGIVLDLEGAIGLQREFVGQAHEMLATHGTMLAKTAEAKNRLTEFEAQRLKLDSLLAGLAVRSETEMSAREDLGKTLVQTGEATVEGLDRLLEETFNQSYPLVQNTYKLMRYLMQMQDVSRAYLAEHDIDNLAKIEKAFAKTVKKSISRLKRLKRRVTTIEDKADVKKIAAAISELKSIVLADGGLFAVHRKSLHANASAVTQQVVLIGISDRYTAALDAIAEQAHGLNRTAKDAANEGTQNARVDIGVIIALGVTIGILFAIFFARSISRPLGQITEAMRRLADGDKSIAIDHADRMDEIGELAQALAVFKESAIEKDRLEAEQAEERAEKAEERAEKAEERATR